MKQDRLPEGPCIDQTPSTMQQSLWNIESLFILILAPQDRPQKTKVVAFLV